MTDRFLSYPENNGEKKNLGATINFQFLPNLTSNHTTCNGVDFFYAVAAIYFHLCTYTVKKILEIFENNFNPKFT